MTFYISAVSDVGIEKKVNQDGAYAALADTSCGNIAFAVLCDGMGGLSSGEIASSTLITAFVDWFRNELPKLTAKRLYDSDIIKQWTSLVENVNERIRAYGAKNNVRLGSTLTALLLTESRYYLLNIGDTRAYQLREKMDQLTVDHTLIEHQVKLGNMTREQGENSPLRSIITRCVGVESGIYPDFFFGPVIKGSVYLLCTDGFRHKINEPEIYGKLYEQICRDPSSAERCLLHLVEVNKLRKEKDNISAITVFAE